MPTNSTEIFYKPPPPFPQVNVVCLDSGEVLHDFFRVTAVNSIDLGSIGEPLLFRSTFFRFVTRVLARIVVSYKRVSQKNVSTWNYSVLSLMKGCSRVGIGSFEKDQGHHKV